MTRSHETAESDQEVKEKPDLLSRYAVALVERAVEIKKVHGIVYFNSDDAPEWALPNDRTTIGAATRMLMASGVIAPFRETIVELHIFGGMRKSTRECCNGHRNPLYQLTTRAEEFLLQHGAGIAKGQMELGLAHEAASDCHNLTPDGCDADLGEPCPAGSSCDLQGGEEEGE